ncbi:hypothetical protein CANARDRAFT_177976 [[Candida] arabinofermentans NRRL YB-2248]|uniref:Aminotransferase class I/classII large domain-containing protein n=1 Tax=[Candida] arabinofermentans NRRL YB-2248 TaxID=983967 RepID=A0A1E4SU70_9ASCO|nr:hypothetical protein CANARDRAFT_177976 [[Candida] arabinofermentans NRRL YB-2248]
MSDYKHQQLLSEHAKSRKLKHFWSQVTLPDGMTPHPEPIQLVGGIPNHEFFPVNKIDIHLSNKPFREKEDVLSSTTFSIPQVSDSPNDEIDIKNGLQYSEVNGLKPLLEFTKEFTKKVHTPGYQAWETTLTCGGANGIDKAFDAFLNPGDTVLIEEFTFTPMIGSINNLKATPIPIKLSFSSESKSLSYVDELRTMLEEWETRYPNLRRPKCLYTIPSGHNPIGLAQSWEHKCEIYKLAQEFNFIIIEDDPYVYLSFQPIEEKPKFDLTIDEFINTLSKSFLRIDVDGRVIRVETFSKVFAPGLRLGFLIGHQTVINIINNYSMISTRSPNGLSQMFVNNTILKLGGLNGWLSWVLKVRNEYLKRKNYFITNLMDTKAYKDGLISILDPNCGMFVCILINFKPDQDVESLMEEFKLKCLIHGIGVVFGGNMSVDFEFSKDRSNFVRTAICYTENLQILKEAGERLSNAVVDLFKSIELVTVL